MAEAYPLFWPIGWPRTRDHGRSPFRRPTFGRARDDLMAELRRLGARDVVLSTNIPLRLDGLPYANTREPADVGAAVYFNRFTVKTGAVPYVLACDRWPHVAENLHALAKHVEALRGQERWGVGTVEQAFAGYAQLPAPSGAPTTPSTATGPRPWREVLGFEFPPKDADAVDRRFRALARERHPDAGGSDAAMAELNVARDAALAELARGGR